MRPSIRHAGGHRSKCPRQQESAGAATGERRGHARLVVVVGFLALCGGTCWSTEWPCAGSTWPGRRRRHPHSAARAKEVTIPDGLTADAVARLLGDQGDHQLGATDFVDVIDARGGSQDLKPGTYTFTPRETLGLDPRKLSSSRDRHPPSRSPSPRALASTRSAARLKADAVARRERVCPSRHANPPDFVGAARSGATDAEVVTLEGLLFPDTYFLRPASSPPT